MINNILYAVFYYIYAVGYTKYDLTTETLPLTSGGTASRIKQLT